MRKAVRTQGDELQDYYTRLTGLDCSGDRDTARQEFKKEADINELIKRFGGITPVTRAGTPQFTETDYNLDLQGALAAIDEARQVYKELPIEVRRDFPSMRSLLNALESGTVTLQTEDKRPTPPKPEGST